jgi:anthranilate phosphoribosyltransferase
VRDIVLLNAAVSLLIADRVASVREGLRVAAHAIDAGAARRVLDAMVAWSHAEVAA